MHSQLYMLNNVNNISDTNMIYGVGRNGWSILYLALYFYTSSRLTGLKKTTENLDMLVVDMFCLNI
jgi:hypothetical protein